MEEELLPCRIPRNEHPVCWERNCYLSGEGCPVHRGPKKHIIRRLPDYVEESVMINGVRVFIGTRDMFRTQSI